MSFPDKIMTTLFIMLFTNFVEASESHKNSIGDISQAVEELNELTLGNVRFYEDRPKNDLQDSKQRIRLSKGQSPPVIILSCSDSRVPPEKIFDQGLGRIFTVRVAGNIANTEAIASIEYALEHLGSRVLIVMGHDSCGAVKAALTIPKGQTAGTPHLDVLLSKIRPHIMNYRVTVEADPTLSIPVKANVGETVKELVNKSHIIRDYFKNNKLLITEAVYRLETGKVDFWVSDKSLLLNSPNTTLHRLPASTADNKDKTKNSINHHHSKEEIHH